MAVDTREQRKSGETKEERPLPSPLLVLGTSSLAYTAGGLLDPPNGEALGTVTHCGQYEEEKSEASEGKNCE